MVANNKINKNKDFENFVEKVGDKMWIFWKDEYVFIKEIRYSC